MHPALKYMGEAPKGMKGKCVECGGDTEIVRRMIGFFGLVENYCTHCRECLPESVRATYDEIVEGVKQAKRGYQERTKT